MSEVGQSDDVGGPQGGAHIERIHLWRVPTYMARLRPRALAPAGVRVNATGRARGRVETEDLMFPQGKASIRAQLVCGPATGWSHDAPDSYGRCQRPSRRISQRRRGRR